MLSNWLGEVGSEQNRNLKFTIVRMTGNRFLAQQPKSSEQKTSIKCENFQRNGGRARFNQVNANGRFYLFAASAYSSRAKVSGGTA